jgi:phosphate-selective porin OprO/OprP
MPDRRSPSLPPVIRTMNLANRTARAAVSRRLLQSAVLSSLAIASHARAEESTTRFIEPTTFDQIWSKASLYKNDLNPWLQEFKLRGRYQWQYYDVDTDRGDAHDDEHRRSRLGFDAKLFDKKVEVRLDAQSNDGFEDLYDGLVDAYVRYKPSSDLVFTLGKTKPLIANYDWLESTNTQPTFERSQIFNQLGINRALGFTVQHTIDAFSWQAGVYSNNTPSTTDDTPDGIVNPTGSFGDGEFGDLNGDIGYSFTLGAGYDFKHLLNLEKADLWVNWLHSEREATDLVLAKYDDIVSATAWLKEGYWGLVVEGFAAGGGEPFSSAAPYVNRDVFGFYIQPTYDLIPKKLQLVGRYTYSTGDGPASIQGQSRYERVSPLPSIPDNIPGPVSNRDKGDGYQAVYLGAQYFIYGDKLKVLAGGEWANLERRGGDIDSLTLLAGLRLSF